MEGARFIGPGEAQNLSFTAPEEAADPLLRGEQVPRRGHRAEHVPGELLDLPVVSEFVREPQIIEGSVPKI